MMDEPFPFVPVFGFIGGMAICSTIIQSIGFGGFLFLMLMCILLVIIGFHEPRKKDEK